jgi:hypothetical protein
MRNLRRVPHTANASELNGNACITNNAVGTPIGPIPVFVILSKQCACILCVAFASPTSNHHILNNRLLSILSCGTSVTFFHLASENSLLACGEQNTKTSLIYGSLSLASRTSCSMVSLPPTLAPTALIASLIMPLISYELL